MPTGKMIGVRIVLQEQWFKVSQVVILPEQSPDAVGKFWSAIIPQVGLHLGKLVYQHLVNYELLVTVCPWRLVFMLSDTFDEKVSHFQIRIAQ